MERPEDRTFDDMLIEDLEPTEEEQRAILGGRTTRADEDAGQNSATPSSGVDAVA